jgi:DNA-binding MarR family transcriptional regulator
MSANRQQQARILETLGAIYRLLLQYLPESATLGEVLVVNEVYRAGLRGESVTVADIARDKDMTEHTIRRVLHRHIAAGFVRETSENSRPRRFEPGANAGEIMRQFTPDLLAVLDKTFCQACRK